MLTLQVTRLLSYITRMKPEVVKRFDNCWEFEFSEFSLDDWNELDNAIDLLGVDNEECVKLLQRITSATPDYHIDAYVHLSMAHEVMGKKLLALDCARKAYAIGSNCLPNEVLEGKGILDWGLVYNRPFLRAIDQLATLYARAGETDKALELYMQGLNVNPIDNQGFRMLALEILWHQEDIERIEVLLNQYDDDHSLEIMFGHAILASIKGNKKECVKRLKQASKHNKWVIPYALVSRKNKKLQKILDTIEYIDPRSSEYAYDYWLRNRKILRRSEVTMAFAVFSGK